MFGASLGGARVPPLDAEDASVTVPIMFFKIARSAEYTAAKLKFRLLVHKTMLLAGTCGQDMQKLAVGISLT